MFIEDDHYGVYIAIKGSPTRENLGNAIDHFKRVFDENPAALFCDEGMLKEMHLLNDFPLGARLNNCVMLFGIPVFCTLSIPFPDRLALMKRRETHTVDLSICNKCYETENNDVESIGWQRTLLEAGFLWCCGFKVPSGPPQLCTYRIEQIMSCQGEDNYYDRREKMPVCDVSSE